jgi:hypothetical protein
MRRRLLEVELAGVGSVVRGPGSRELLIEETGRVPVWIPRLRGWSCQERAARSVVARAEVRNYDVVVTGPRAASSPVVRPTQVAEQPDPAGGLW